MQLTVSQYSFEAIPFEGTLAICQSMGFHGVVVSAFKDRGRDGLDPDAVAAEPQKWADHLNALLDRYQLECVDFFPQLALSFYDRALNNPNTAIRDNAIETFRGLIRFTRLINAPGITVLPGAPFLGRTEEENLSLSAQMLRQIVDMGDEQGVEVYFEPHFGSVAEQPEHALWLVEHVPGVTLALDYSHFVVRYTPVERVHPLIPHTGTFHIRQARPGKIQTRYTEGTIDFIDVVKRLEASGYKGCLTIEYVCADWFGANEADTLTETMVTKDALAQYVPVR